MRFTPQDEEFRAEVRDWLNANLTGEFAGLRGAGGLGREHERHDERLAWNRHLAAAGWTCLGWPAEHGGRGATLTQQVIFYEEYAQADAPARVCIVNCSARPCSRSARRISSSASCRRSGPSPNCGARATPNPGPAPTWPAWPPGRPWTGTGG